MAHAAIVNAVEARLQTRWTACPVFGINLQGDTPVDGSVFANVQYPVATVSQRDLAGHHYVEEGTIRLIVNAQRGAGVAAGLAMVDDLAALFRGKKFDGVQTFAPSSPVVDDRNDDGMYFPLSVSVPYRFEFTDPSGFYG